MLTLSQQIYVDLKKYGIKKKESSHQISGIFLPDSTIETLIHHIITLVQTVSEKSSEEDNNA